MNKSDYDKIALALYADKPSYVMYEDDDYVCGMAEGRVEKWDNIVDALTHLFRKNDNFDDVAEHRFLKIAHDGTLLAMRS